MTMINPIDRTDEFLRALATHHALPSSTQVSVKQPPATPQHDFTVQALELSHQIATALISLRKSQDRYNDFSQRGMSDAERDKVDTAVAQLLETALTQIDRLKRQAVEQLSRERGASFPAHKLGVVVILNDDLQEVSTIAERMRAARVRQAIADKDRTRVQYDHAVVRQIAEEQRRRDGDENENGDGDGDGNENEMGMLEQEFARENATLVNELVETRERVREAERTVYAIANMNQVFATKVLEQAKEIETLYDLAVEATNLAERGNRELGKMQQRGPIGKYVLAVLALFLALTLLLFEWVGRKTRVF